MTFAFTIFLFTAAMLFSWRKKLRLAVSIFIAAILFSLFVGQGWLAAILLAPLQTTPYLSNPTWQEHNAIVVLGIGKVRWPNESMFTTQALGQSRLLETVRLYKLCLEARKSCYVIPSGGDPQRYGKSEASVMKRELTKSGVKETDIIEESKSNNTFQNAQFTADILPSLNVNQIILVTSGAHLKRSLLYFSHFDLLPVGAPSDRLEPFKTLIPIAHNFSYADIAIHELLGIPKYHLYNFFGWNQKTSKPGSI